jgi:hypothetical protein
MSQGSMPLLCPSRTPACIRICAHSISSFTARPRAHNKPKSTAMAAVPTVVHSEENPMKTVLYCTFLVAPFVTGMPAKASCNSQSDDRRHSKTVIVESPSALPELAQPGGEGLYLHACGDGITFIFVEGFVGKYISILDVTNPHRFMESRGQTFLQQVPLTSFNHRTIGLSLSVIEIRRALLC